MSGVPATTSQGSAQSPTGIGPYGSLGQMIPYSSTPQIGSPAQPPQVQAAPAGMPQAGGGAKGGMGQQMPGAFSQPNSTANASNTTAVPPQLVGGLWNQMTQALAGPNYVPMMQPSRGGAVTTMPGGRTVTPTSGGMSQIPANPYPRNPNNPLPNFGGSR